MHIIKTVNIYNFGSSEYKKGRGRKSERKKERQNKKLNTTRGDLAQKVSHLLTQTNDLKSTSCLIVRMGRCRAHYSMAWHKYVHINIIYIIITRYVEKYTRKLELRQ